MSRLTLTHTGLVYRNPAPHLRPRQAYYPSVVTLGGAQMLASFMIASAMESVDGQMHLARSEDAGRTWSAPQPLHPKQPEWTETGRITHLGGGRGILLLSETYRPNPDVGATNPKNLGHAPTRLSLMSSDDGGANWSEPRRIDPPLVGPTFELCSPVVPLSDGRWLLPTSTWRGWDGDQPNGMKAVAFVSDDQGQTWPRHVDVMDGSRDGVLFWEQKIVAIDRGRLLAVAWAHEERTRRDRPNHFAVASQADLDFTPPAPLDLHGQTPELLHLGEGRVLCAYRRTDEPGLWGALAQIDADGRWRTLSQQPLWRPALPPPNQQQGGLVETFRGLKFGAPCLRRLDDGQIYLAFWCIEDCVANIRWMTLEC